MNNDILIYVKNRLKEDGYLEEDSLIAEYVLELFETLTEQSHDEESLDATLKLFFLYWIEFKA